ncbi:hypothetical protein DFH11DRAFT_449596 [Phellopilus nigrolimitatus]|nr:hypothetical protein DFH11DRAFT_449596 [Phellopilus nigrolimitatus]
MSYISYPIRHTYTSRLPFTQVSSLCFVLFILPRLTSTYVTAANSTTHACPMAPHNLYTLSSEEQNYGVNSQLRHLGDPATSCFRSSRLEMGLRKLKTCSYCFSWKAKYPSPCNIADIELKRGSGGCLSEKLYIFR